MLTIFLISPTTRLKSLYDALTLVIGRLKTVVDLASGLSKRWHGHSEPKAPCALTHDWRLRRPFS